MRFFLGFRTLLCAVLMATISASTAFAQNDPRPRAAPSIAVDTGSLPPPAPSRDEAVLEAFVDGVVAAHLREHLVPGVAVSVVRNGRPLFAKGYGVADVESGAPVLGDETLFRIGSVSKTFVWTAVMMLVERGLLDLDVDVNVYLNGVTIPDAFDAPVTMNDLMAHRAGFEDTFGVFTHPDEGGLSLTDALNKDMPARVFPPGARTSYSNWGSALAAKIVEDISGRTFDSILTEDMLTPLGMTHTTLRGPLILSGPMKASLSRGHIRKDGAATVNPPMQIGAYAPVGAMAASASDMAQWMLMHLGGGAVGDVRLMQPGTHKKMWTRQYTDRMAADDLAHGFFAEVYGDLISFGHGGGTAAFLTNLVMIPELNVGVFVSQNSLDGGDFVRDLPTLIMDHLNGPRGSAIAQNEQMDPEAEPDLSAFTGTYLGNRRSFTRFEKLFALGDVRTVTVDAGGLIVTAAGEALRYEPIGVDGVFENERGRRLAFNRAETGAVTHYAVGAHSFERAGFATNPILFNGALGAAFLMSMTMFAGAWRRGAAGAPSTARPSSTGRRLGVFDLIAGGGIFILVMFIVMLTVQLSSATASDLLHDPPAALTVMRLFSHIIFVLGVLAFISIIPAWVMTGWSIWRKSHHTLFALSYAALAVMLFVWRVVFSATA